MVRLGSRLSEARARVAALPTGLKVVLGIAVVAIFAVGSVLLYQTYEYVEHDNQFCLECHLMRDPFERFARSAHRELGCKACHRPNIVERSQMGLAQVIEQPDSIRVHAHVPNSVCAECHIEGDPERWRHVASTAGHRIHLESSDPALAGFQCVECHSTGVHEFAPTDRTCGQGGCHETTTIQLGRMADLTIHCATCHEFNAPVAASAGPEQVATSLRPQAQECLSCHQMRLLVTDLPADDPHDGVCGACHNPHQQETPQQAVQTCTSSGCHEQPARTSAFHRGLDVGVLEDCSACHTAHEFRIPHGGQDCLACHADIYTDAPGRGMRVAPPGDGRTGFAPGGGALALASLALASHAPVARAAAQDPRLPQHVLTRDTLGFWHSQHRDVECTECHSTRDRHGALTVTSIRDCRSCHHTAPVATPCAQCHDRSAVQRLTVPVQQTMNIQVGRLDRPRRTLPFAHGDHLRYDCQRCHTQGLSLSARGLDCASCHQEHHQPAVSCMACHPAPAADAHDLDAHLGCAECHTAPQSVAAVPRTRDFCLVCHQGLTDHRPGRNCAGCHALPQSAGSGPGIPGGQRP